MFFPYREIDVVNHMVFRSQNYISDKGNYIIKYNALMLEDVKEFEVHQFSQNFINPEFAGFDITSGSAEIYSDQITQILLNNTNFTNYQLDSEKKQIILKNISVNPGDKINLKISEPYSKKIFFARG